MKPNAAFDGDDLYDALGVSPGASEADIVRAFRRASMLHHPDRQKGRAAPGEPGVDQYADEGDARRQQLLNHAYEVLRDAARRREYDLGRPLRADATRGRAARHEPPAPVRRVLRRRIDITLREQVFGGGSQFRMNDSVACARCDGRGSLDDGVALCARCAGRAAPDPGCPACHGLGRVEHRSPCPACSGKGRRKTGERDVPFVIRPGLRAGDRIVIDREGLYGPDGRPCGVEIDVAIVPDPVFEMRHPDLHCTVPVGLFHLLAGLPVNVPTVDGVTGIAPDIGAVLAGAPAARLAGQGMRSAGGARGDLVVSLRVMTEQLALVVRDPLEHERLRLLAAGEESTLASTEAMSAWRSRLLAHGGGPAPGKAGRGRRKAPGGPTG
jgi:DnaJ-class molecular chaperone